MKRTKSDSQDKDPAIAAAKLTDDILQKLVPINRLSQQQRALLFERAELQSRRRGCDLLAETAGSRDVLYLIEGRVELREAEGDKILIEAGSDAARLPLIPLHSPPGSVKASTVITLLRCDRVWLDALLLPPLLLPYCHSPEAAGAEPVDWLQQLFETSLFRQLPPSCLQQLFSRAEPVAYAAGQTVASPGQNDGCFYLIQSGSCEVLQTDANGRVLHTLAELGPGSWFGEVSLLSGTPGSVTINMRREGALLRIDRNSFDDCIRIPLMESVDLKMAQARADTGACWLDVRGSAEYESQHQPAALHCPLSEILAHRTAALQLGQHYIVYCDSGARSAVAAFLLALRGYTVSWLCNRLPTTESVAGETIHDTDALRPDPLLTVLRGELTSLLQQVDNAMRIKHEAEAARREAAQAAKARLEEERHHLDEQAQQVRNMLTQTQQLQQRLVREKDRLYTGLRQRERAVEERMNNLNAYIEGRVSEEREKLEAHYRQREHEIRQLQQKKAAAELRLQALRNSGQDCGHEQSVDNSNLDTGLDDRQALEQEFAQYSEVLRVAEDTRREPRPARSAVPDEVQELMNELGHQTPAHLEVAREKLQRQRQQLETSGQELSTQVEQKLLDKQATQAVQEALQHEAEQLQRQDDDNSVDPETLESARAQVAAAVDRYNRADKAYAAALAAKEKNDEALAETEQAEDELIREMSAEIETWLKEEAERPKSPRQTSMIKNYEETMQRLQDEAVNAEENERTHDHLLLSEINAALEDIAAGRTKQDD